MRKPRRLPADATAPFVWEWPHVSRGMWGDQPPPDPAAPPTRLDWPGLFGNPNPVEVEVGFGKGLFLVTAGTSRPDRNFFGVEIVRKYQMYAANRVARRGLGNVRTCCGDAKAILRDYIPPGSVEAVHVYFPDPWWKTKHVRRRVFTPEFADLVLSALRPGGCLYFVSDVADYFEMVTAILVQIPAFRPVPPVPESDPRHDMDYLTNFERKFRKEGRPIYRSRYEKVMGAAPPGTPVAVGETGPAA